MNKKAIKIDLSTFFDDERKMSYVLVDPNWKSVACLQKRVELLFDVDSVRFLSDGCFLPPQESIEIFRFCSDIKAFVPKESLELRKKKKSNKCNNVKKSSKESDNEDTVISDFDEQHLQGKRKYNIWEHKNLSNKAKRSKTKNEFDETLHEIESKKSKGKKSKISIVTSDYEESTDENKSCGSKTKATETSSNLNENTLVNGSSDDQYKKQQTSTPKGKKKKEMEKIEENTVDKTSNDETETTMDHASNIPSSTFNESKMIQQCDKSHRLLNTSNLNNPFKNKKPKASGAHIYFDETGEIASPKAKTKSKSKPKEQKTIVIFRCPLSDDTNGVQPQKPRIFHLKSKNIANNMSKKQVVEIQEEIILTPNPLQSVINQIPSPKAETEKANKAEKQNETNEITNETDKTDSLNENGSSNNTTIVTQNEKTEQVDTKDLEVSQNEETNVEKKNKSKLEHTSIMSVDCVDLSIDLDDDDIVMEKKEAKKIKLNESKNEKHDLTADDESNNSSASDIEEISEIIDLNETEDNFNITKNKSTQHNNSLSDIRVDKILPFCTILTGLPNTEDIIVFKIPYLNQNKKSVNSNFIAGKVEYINRRTKIIKILIIDGALELCHISSKFFCNLDDSQDFVKHLQLRLNDMREVKLFSKA